MSNVYISYIMHLILMLMSIYPAICILRSFFRVFVHSPGAVSLIRHFTLCLYWDCRLPHYYKALQRCYGEQERVACPPARGRPGPLQLQRAYRAAGHRHLQRLHWETSWWEVEAERVPADDAESSPKERFKKDGEARVQVRLDLFWAELEGNVVFLAEVAERGEGDRKKWKKFLYHIYTFQTTSKLKKSKENVSKMGQFWPIHQVENSTFFIYFFYPQPSP